MDWGIAGLRDWGDWRIGGLEDWDWGIGGDWGGREGVGGGEEPNPMGFANGKNGEEINKSDHCPEDKSPAHHHRRSHRHYHQHHHAPWEDSLVHRPHTSIPTAAAYTLTGQRERRMAAGVGGGAEGNR